MLVGAGCSSTVFSYPPPNNHGSGVHPLFTNRENRLPSGREDVHRGSRLLKIRLELSENGLWILRGPWRPPSAWSAVPETHAPVPSGSGPVQRCSSGTSKRGSETGQGKWYTVGPDRAVHAGAVELHHRVGWSATSRPIRLRLWWMRQALDGSSKEPCRAG